MRFCILTVLLFCVAPVSAQNGFLQVFVTEPGIEITVGDLSPEFANPSEPLQYGLAPGSYVIIAGKAGFRDLIQTAEIRTDQLTKVIINLYQGPLKKDSSRARMQMFLHQGSDILRS